MVVYDCVCCFLHDSRETRRKAGTVQYVQCFVVPVCTGLVWVAGMYWVGVGSRVRSVHRPAARTKQRESVEGT